MADYDKGKYRFEKVSGLSTLDIAFFLDESSLDGVSSVYAPVEGSVVTINDRYSIGDAGELSLDPVTATATVSTYVEGPVTPDADLVVGNYVESYYDGVLNLQALVREVNVEITPSYDAFRNGQLWEKRITYSLSSLELILLSQTVSWEYLPSEPAIVRLSRWFSIDTSAVAASHLSRLNIEVDSVEEGSSSLLDMARAFSAATLIPLRTAVYRGPYFLEAFDTSQVWDDQPLTPVTGFDDATQWSTSVGFSSSMAHPTPLPVSLSVRTDDMRLLGGIENAPIASVSLDVDFVLDSSRLDGVTSQPVGFRAPMPIEAFGFVLPVLGVTQTFGEHYNASIEIDPSSAAGVSPVPVPTGEPTQPPVVVETSVRADAPLLPNGESASVFDGHSDFLEAIDSNIFSISNTGLFSWTVWIRPDDLEFAKVEQSGYVHFLGKGVSTQQEWVGRMYGLTTTEVPPRPNRISGYAYNLSGALGSGAYFEDELTAGVWIQVTVTYNVAADRIRIYRDGVLRGESTFSSFSVVPANGTAPLRVGTRDGNSFFCGAIGKLAIYNRELSGPEIEAQYRAMVSKSIGYDSLVMGSTPVAYWSLGTNLVEQMGTGRNMVRYRATSTGYNVLVDNGPYGIRIQNGAAQTFEADHLGNLNVSNKIASGATGASSSAQVTAANPTAGHTVFHGQVVDAAGNLIRGLVAGDSTHRVILSMSRLSFGNGSVAADTNLYRSAANVLRTDDSFEVAGSITSDSVSTGAVTATTINGSSVTVTGDTTADNLRANTRVYVGSAGDTSLFRDSAAPVLRTSGAFVTGKWTTATRPAASTVGQGASIYDTTLNRQLWSDGSVWRNAAGTAV